MEVQRYERNGQVWETHPFIRTRYAGEPCVQLDMRGDPDTFFGGTVDIIEATDLGDGWTRYWYTDRDPDLRASTARIVELEEYGRKRGWND
jgi:hypothetical protein